MKARTLEPKLRRVGVGACVGDEDVLRRCLGVAGTPTTRSVLRNGVRSGERGGLCRSSIDHLRSETGQKSGDQSGGKEAIGYALPTPNVV